MGIKNRQNPSGTFEPSGSNRSDGSGERKISKSTLVSNELAAQHVGTDEVELQNNAESLEMNQLSTSNNDHSLLIKDDQK